MVRTPTPTQAMPPVQRQANNPPIVGNGNQAQPNQPNVGGLPVQAGRNATPETQTFFAKMKKLFTGLSCCFSFPFFRAARQVPAAPLPDIQNPQVDVRTQARRTADTALGKPLSDLVGGYLAKSMDKSPTLKQNIEQMADEGWKFDFTRSLTDNQSATAVNAKRVFLSSEFIAIQKAEVTLASLAFQTAYATSDVELDWSSEAAFADSYARRVGDAALQLAQICADLKTEGPIDITRWLGALSPAMGEIAKLKVAHTEAGGAPEDLVAQVGALLIKGDQAIGILKGHYNVQMAKNVPEDRNVLHVFNANLFRPTRHEQPQEDLPNTDVVGRSDTDDAVQPETDLSQQPVTLAPEQLGLEDDDVSIMPDDLFGWTPLDTLLATDDIRRQRADDAFAARRNAGTADPFPGDAADNLNELDDAVAPFEDRLQRYLGSIGRDNLNEAERKTLDAILAERS